MLDDVLDGYYASEASLALHHIGQIMDYPCCRLGLPYDLADPFQARTGGPVQNAGFARMMGAGAFGDADHSDPAAVALIRHMVHPSLPVPPDDTPFLEVGAEEARFPAETFPDHGESVPYHFATGILSQPIDKVHRVRVKNRSRDQNPKSFPVHSLLAGSFGPMRSA